MEKEIMAAVMAATVEPDYQTNDRCK